MPIGTPDLTTEQLAPRKGWTEPLPGSEYRLPLEVMYLPGDPKKAMEKQEALGSATVRFGTFRWFYAVGGGALALTVLSFSGWLALRSRT